MNYRFKIGLTAATLALLVACSSGIQEFDTAELTLEPQATGSFWDRVGTSADDAEQLPSGYLTLTGPDLDIGEKPNGDNIITGLRFPGATIPQGATIDTVQLTFRPVTSNSTTASVTVRAQDTDTAAPFSTAFQDLSSRTKTSASATWSVPAWTAGTDSTFTNSAALNAVVQEVVNRPGWKSGNALAFFISGTGVRTAYSYDELAGAAPVLFVAYSTATEPPPVSEASKVWIERTKYALEYGKTHDTGWDHDLEQHASSGDIYRLGRMLNDNVTALIHVYRVTGDRYFINEVNRLLQLARADLRDTNSDSYVNWTYLSGKSTVSECRAKFLNSSTPKDADFCGGDRHEMEEMLAHSMVAAAAHALKEAGGFSANVTFWTDYLENDFEKKWRTRNNKLTGINFIGTNDLMHPETQFIRYFYYMYKLTGKGSYLTNAQAQVDRVQGAIRTSSLGTTRVWSHSIRSGHANYDDCALPDYVGYTTQAMQDLNMMEFDIFASEGFIRSVAKTVATYQIKETTTPRVGMDVCGGDNRAGLTSNGVEATGLNAGSLSTRYSVGKWDSTGRVRATVQRLYDLRETNLDAPTKSVLLPAMMVSILN